MKVEQTKKIDAAIEQLAAELEQGRSATLKAYLSAMGRFHRYSVFNMMLIVTARPDATRVAGFHAWRKLGRNVRKGEKGIAILAPIVRRSKVVPDVQDDAPGRERESVAGFRKATVFDVKQTQGRELPKIARVHGNPGSWLERLNALIRGRGIQVRYEDDLRGAEGCSMNGMILVRNGMSDAETFSVLVHEYCHETLHHDGASRSKTVQEVEAEAVAFAVCEAVGLESRYSSSDYLHLYDGKKETLMASLERIRSLAREIIEAIQPDRRIPGMDAHRVHSEVSKSVSCAVNAQQAA